jgi:hypothetical protein
VVVLDGVTVRTGMETGCTHGTPWYVARLGGELLARAADPAIRLADALAASIAAVAALHAGTCDLSTPGAPSAAVGVLRFTGDGAECLSLADVTILLDGGEGIKVVSDDRVAASVAGVPTTGPDVGARIAQRRAADRNRPGGYWVAAADPEAAFHAVTGFTRHVRRTAVMTDGAARAADMFGASWEGVLAMDATALIADVRLSEARDQSRERWPRFKISDDATAVFWAP